MARVIIINWENIIELIYKIQNLNLDDDVKYRNILVKLLNEQKIPENEFFERYC